MTEPGYSLSGLSPRREARKGVMSIGFLAYLAAWREQRCHVHCFLGVLGGLARTKVSCPLVSWRAWRLGESKAVMSIVFLACLAAWREQQPSSMHQQILPRSPLYSLCKLPGQHLQEFLHGLCPMTDPVLDRRGEFG